MKAGISEPGKTKKGIKAQCDQPGPQGGGEVNEGNERSEGNERREYKNKDAWECFVDSAPNYTEKSPDRRQTEALQLSHYWRFREASSRLS